MSAEVWDDRPCALGEGPLWHPERGQLFWFDITAGKLLCRDASGPLEWQFDEMVSAAGWTHRDGLLVASETRLFTVDLATGDTETVCLLEANNPVTRSNDGRADPWGGFWIGTMGKNAEPGAGAIYRWYRGELRALETAITISNAICFAPDHSAAYWTDTMTKVIRRQPLDPDTGWPAGEAAAWLDLTEAGLSPDGAVTDAEGNVWIAQWGASRVAGYTPDGRLLGAVPVGGRHSSCPALGGPDLGTMFVTTAREGLAPDILAAEPGNGCVFAAPAPVAGRPEPRVIL